MCTLYIHILYWHFLNFACFNFNTGARLWNKSTSICSQLEWINVSNFKITINLRNRERVRERQTKQNLTKPNRIKIKPNANKMKRKSRLHWSLLHYFSKYSKRVVYECHVWFGLVLAKLILNGNKRPPNCGAIVILLHATLFLTIPHSACVYRLQNSFGRWFGSGESVHFVWIKWWKLLAESQSI